MSADPPRRSPPGGAVRQELGRAAELAALVGFAVVQPVLGPFGESPGTFVAAGASPGTIVAFALVVAVVPTLALVGIGVASRALGPQVRSWVQTTTVAALAAVAVVALVRHLDAGAALRALAGVAAGAGAVVAHRRWRPARLFLRYASPTPVALVAVFLLASPVAPLVRPPSVAVDRAAAAGDHPPVVVIVLDELPTLSLLDAEGAIDGRLFPNVARLAAQATWYRNHTVVAPTTASSLPALVTGRLPPPGPEPPAVHGEHPENLFTLLGPTHDVHAVEWITELCPPSLCPARAVALDAEAEALLADPVGDRRRALPSLLDQARSLWWDQAWPLGATGDPDYQVGGVSEPHDLARPGLEFLSGLAAPDGDRPTLDYLHVPIPHAPWRLLPSGGYHAAPHPAGDGGAFYAWADDELGHELGATARSYHLLQMQWTDRLLGAVFDRLEELGRWDDAVVVVTADHGVSFSRGQPQRPVEPGNQVEIAWTPLLVKAPGQDAPRVVDDNVLAVDVLPTVADLAGVEVPWALDGASLVAGVPPRPDATKPIVARDPERFASRLDGDLVALDADGLAVLRAGTDRPAGPDELLAWRHGRHGDLLGRAVDELGACGSGRPVRYRPPEGWDRYRDGLPVASGEPVPIWHHGSLDGPGGGDVVAAVDGTVAAWAPARPADGGRFDLLLAEPLVAGGGADPVLYEVVDGAGDRCRLRELAPR